MKKLSISLMTAAIALLAGGCFSHDSVVGVPGKEIILPAKDGEKSLPAGEFIAIGDRWASEQTEVIVQRAGDKIRFEIVCWGITADLEWSDKKADDDMTLFGGEHVELLIAPRGLNDDACYYHFAINPAGSVYHAKRRDTEWGLGIESFSTAIEPGRWIATFEIPVMAMTLDKTGETGAMWNINICRTIKKKGKDAEHTSWTGSSNFHDIATMGQLHFNKMPPSDHFRLYTCSFDKYGLLDLSIRKTGKEHAYLQVYDNGKFVTNLKLHGTDPHIAKLKLKDNYISLKGTRKIELYLLGPYRVPIQELSTNIVVCEKDFLSLDKMEYINTEEMTCDLLVVPGKIVIRDDSGVIREQKVMEKTAKISLADLKPGRYILEYISDKILTADGKTYDGKSSSRVFYISETPAELPELPEKRIITVKGNDLQLNQKPFYLLGISGGSKTYFPVNAGFTLRYGLGYRKNALNYSGVPGRRLVRKPQTGYAFSKNWEEVVLKHLKKIGKARKGNWNILCYEASLAVLHPDEKGTLKVDPEGHKIYQKIYKMAKKEAPDEIFSIQIDNMNVIKNYIDSCDVLEYASGRSSYSRTNMIENLGADFDHVRRIAGEKPLVLWLGGTIPTPDCRTAEEIRAGVYYTILKGGAGNIIHMGHGGMPENRTRFWSMLSMLSREVEAFYADLKTWKELEIKLPKQLIGKAVSGPEGQLLLVVLNTTPGEVTAVIELPGFGKEKLTFTPFEPRVIRKEKPVEKEKTADKK